MEIFEAEKWWESLSATKRCLIAHDLSKHCDKCHQRKHSICAVACNCWMLETGKITQNEYNKLMDDSEVKR